jgi:MerR family transcriptional regulator, light-induced transcriptional regulator
MTTASVHEDAYWQAVSAGDEDRAHAVVDDARDGGTPVVDIFTRLVLRTQERVGEQWAANAWTVAHEHAATAVSEAVVLRLADTIEEPSDGRPLLVACAEREWHALPALVVTHALRSWGYPAVHVGANASTEGLVGRILDTGPRGVLVSASLSSSLPHVRRLVEAVRGTGTPVIVGGRAFDPAGVRAERIGATAYAAHLGQARDLVEALPSHVSPAPPLRHPGAAEALVIQASADEIGRDLLSRSGSGAGMDAGAHAPDDWRVVLATYVPHVVGCVVGGLLTEDPTVPGDARQWLVDVLTLRGGDPSAVEDLWAGLVRRLHDFPEALALLERA